jgi:hypothetical protein
MAKRSKSKKRASSGREGSSKKHRISQAKEENPPFYFSNTDLTDLESQRCDVIDEISLYERKMTEFEDCVLPALAMRNYHIPGNTYWQDLVQYFRNNHPVIGIFCHHPRHPIRCGMRLLQLFSSVIFGLAITNVIWLWFYFSKANENEPVVTIGLPGSSSNGKGSSSSQFDITHGMIILWTVGGTVHAIYDNTIWYISACVCCLSSQNLDAYRKWGTYLIITVSLTVAAIATLALLLRTSAEAEATITDDDVLQIKFYDQYVYEFLVSYAIVLVLSLFLYYPVVAFVFFSGVLSCGFNVPVLGGRPYEVWLAEKAERLRRQSRASEFIKTLG